MRSDLRNGGNHWLHPDVVAMQPMAKNWHELVRTCVLQGGGQSVRLWAFEVKKELNRGNVRKYFFQAVSNSSWANEGYLACTGIVGKDTEDELRMLSALHGKGLEQNLIEAAEGNSTKLSRTLLPFAAVGQVK